MAAGRVAALLVCGRSGAPAPSAAAQADVLLRNSEEALAEFGVDWPSAQPIGAFQGVRHRHRDSLGVRAGGA